MKTGYIVVDATGIELTTGSTPLSIAGIWAKALKAIACGKPIVAENLTYDDNPLTPVNCFGWLAADDEIIMVAATIHVHIKDDDTVTTVDVST